MTLEISQRFPFEPSHPPASHPEGSAAIEWVDHRDISRKIRLVLASLEGVHPQDLETKAVVSAEIEKDFRVSEEDIPVAIQLMAGPVVATIKKLWGDKSLANGQFGRRIELSSENRGFLTTAVLLDLQETQSLKDWKQYALFQAAQAQGLNFEQLEKHAKGGYLKLLGLLAKLPIKDFQKGHAEAVADIEKEISELKTIWSNVAANQTEVTDQARATLLSYVEGKDAKNLQDIATTLDELIRHPSTQEKTIQTALQSAQTLLNHLIVETNRKAHIEQAATVPFMTSLGKMLLLDDQKSQIELAPLPATQHEIVATVVNEAMGLTDLDFVGLLNHDQAAVDQLRRRLTIISSLQEITSGETGRVGFTQMIQARREEVRQGNRRWKENFKSWDTSLESVAHTMGLVAQSDLSPKDRQTLLLGEAFMAGYTIIMDLKELNRKARELAEHILSGTNKTAENPSTLWREKPGKDQVLWQSLGVQVPQYPQTVAYLPAQAVERLQTFVDLKPHFLDLTSADVALNWINDGERIDLTGQHFEDAYNGWLKYLESLI